VGRNGHGGRRFDHCERLVGVTPELRGGWSRCPRVGNPVFAGEADAVRRHDDWACGGNGGYTTAQILSIEVPIIVSKKPTFCVVIAGANDFANSVAFSTTISNYKLILDTLRTAGVIPIVTTLPPRTGPPANLRALNVWLRSYANTNGLPFADAFGAVVDTTTTGHIPGCEHVGRWRASERCRGEADRTDNRRGCHNVSDEDRPATRQ
jgi:lysophospholipase L1-like esterase